MASPPSSGRRSMAPLPRYDQRMRAAARDRGHRPGRRRCPRRPGGGVVVAGLGIDRRPRPASTTAACRRPASSATTLPAREPMTRRSPTIAPLAHSSGRGSNSPRSWMGVRQRRRGHARPGSRGLATRPPGGRAGAADSEASRTAAGNRRSRRTCARRAHLPSSTASRSLISFLERALGHLAQDARGRPSRRPCPTPSAPAGGPGCTGPGRA